MLTGELYQSAKAIPKTNITMAGRYTSQCTLVRKRISSPGCNTSRN